MLVADLSRLAHAPASARLLMRGALRVLIILAALVTAAALTGCFFGEDDPPGDKPPVSISPCVDVAPAVRAKADSLVAAGNREMVDNFDYWFSRSDDWWDAKARSPQGALDDYDDALRAAPGHCQAVFGKAMASATMLTQDRRMDDFIRKVEATDGPIAVGKVAAKTGGGHKARPPAFAALFKTPPEQAAPALVKLSARLERVDPPTVKEAQELIEKVIMPKLDSAIAALETIMDYRMFAVRFDVDGDSVEIDRGEIGPGLAGLKVAKAWLTVVAGYDLDLTPDGNYDWIRTLDDLRQEDYDRLTAGQTAALDRLTGLFKTSSPFTRMKPAWKARINGIPELLLSAVGDAQKGLESAIEEARSGDSQRYDVWRAGDGEDDDVDTVDVRNVIDLLERSKKYLTGEVPVEYDRGSKTVKVDFTRLFHVDGLQGMLPHFKFLPYAEWNDTLTADTVWGGGYLSYESWAEILAKTGYSPRLLDGDPEGQWNLSIRDSLAWDNPLPFTVPKLVARNIVLYRWEHDTLGGFSDYSTILLATLVPDSASPCTQVYTRFRSAEAGPSGIVTAPDDGGGTFSLSSCRVMDGQVQYVSWVDAVTKGPFVFTDAAGNKTLSIQEIDDIDDPAELTGKVVFRDPTFGGILPGQTNDTFWENVSSISHSPGDRVRRECRDVEEDGFIYWKCTRTLPSNPSDLDYLVYYLDWWGEPYF